MVDKKKLLDAAEKLGLKIKFNSDNPGLYSNYNHTSYSWNDMQDIVENVFDAKQENKYLADTFTSSVQYNGNLSSKFKYIDISKHKKQNIFFDFIGEERISDEQFTPDNGKSGHFKLANLAFVEV